MKSIVIVAPQTSILKWTVNDVRKQHATKVSPILEMPIGESEEKVVMSVTNYYNLIQIKIQPVQRLDLLQLVAHASSASLTFRFGENQIEKFDNLLVQSMPSIIIIEMTSFCFTTVTQDYQKPFEIELHIHFRPIPMRSIEANLPTPSAFETVNEQEQVTLVWQINNVDKMPLLKRSPLFTFNVGAIKHQVLFTLETNKNRLRLRICPFLTFYKYFAQSIDTVSLVLQSNDNRQPPIKIEKLKVKKVISGLIYLSTTFVSFSQITVNNQIPFELTIQLNLQKTQNTTTELNVGPHMKPVDFTWKMFNFQEYPLVKGSPWFNLRMYDGSWMNVAFWLAHRTNQPIQIGMKTHLDKHKLALSIDRVTMEFVCGSGLIRKVTRVLPHVIDDLLYFDLEDNHFFFSELTNDYKESFQILFRMHPPSPEDILVGHQNTTSLAQSLAQTKRPSSEPVKSNLVQSMESLTIHTTTAPPPIAITNYLFAPNPQPTELLQQLNQLLVDQVDCDVHFDCQGTRLGAHRPILQSRSGLFKNLHQQHSDQSLFHFKSVDAQTMADTLQFIYTGTAPQIANTADRLLSVANLMELPELYEMAQQQLLKTSRSSACTSNTSKLLDLFDDKHLRPEVGAFIETNLDELLANSNFEQELKKRPDACFGIINLVFGQKST